MHIQKCAKQCQPELARPCCLSSLKTSLSHKVQPDSHGYTSTMLAANCKVKSWRGVAFGRPWHQSNDKLTCVSEQAFVTYYNIYPEKSSENTLSCSTVMHTSTVLYSLRCYVLLVECRNESNLCEPTEGHSHCAITTSRFHVIKSLEGGRVHATLKSL